MKTFIFAAAMALSTSSFADTWWLNVPEHYDPIEGKEMPATSFITSSHDACSNAIIAYAKDNLVHWIGCSVKPLPNAVNISDRVKNAYRHK